MIVQNAAPVGAEDVPRPSQQNSHTNLVGTVLADRYRLVKMIGEGGMGSVYQAEHITIGRKLAVKVLAPEYCDSPEVVARFLQEARTASMLHHEHIVDITDFGYTKNGLAFLTMEYLEGEDLATLLAREGKQPWTRVRRMVLQVCRALDAAHEKSIIHRDMKPDNCFRIRRGGNHDFIKILDFGIAKVIADGQNPGREGKPKMATEAGTLLGTPEYMAPEIARDQKADARVDVYSVGVVMYELLTGSVPFKGQTFMATVAMQMVDEPEPPRKRAPSADIPEAIEQVVLRALKKDPAERFQTIRDLAQAIIDADRTLRYTSQGMPALAWETDDYAGTGDPSGLASAPLEASQRVHVGAAPPSGVMRPPTAQLPTVQPTPPPQPPQLPETDDDPSLLTRSNPYRVLTVLLLLVVLGLGGVVYYLLYLREREPPGEPREPIQTIVIPTASEDPTKAEAGKKDDAKKDEGKKDEGKKPDPKKDDPRKPDPKPEDGKKPDPKPDDGKKDAPKREDDNRPSKNSQEEADKFFPTLIGLVSKCGRDHGVTGVTVRTTVIVEANTGRLDVALRSAHPPAFNDCVKKAIEKKRFKTKRQGFTYNADYTI